MGLEYALTCGRLSRESEEGVKASRGEPLSGCRRAITTGEDGCDAGGRVLLCSDLAANTAEDAPGHLRS